MSPRSVAGTAVTPILALWLSEWFLPSFAFSPSPLGPMPCQSRRWEEDSAHSHTHLFYFIFLFFPCGEGLEDHLQLAMAFFPAARALIGHFSTRCTPDVIALLGLQKAGSCWSKRKISDVMPGWCWVESYWTWSRRGGVKTALWGPTLQRHCRFVLSHVPLNSLCFPSSLSV